MDNLDAPISAQPVTVIEQSVRKLRSAIMCGDLRPGQKLVEADLCEDLTISRASLREALRALEAERLIELVPNRGPFVAKLGSKEVEELHDVWAMLTSEAVYRFAEIAKPEEITTLDAIFKRLKAALQNRDTLDQLGATNAFFSFILERCGNNVLIDTVYSLVSRLNFLRAQALSHEGWALLCAQELEEILSAIRDHRPAAARTAIRRHIGSACSAAKQVTVQAKPQASRRRIAKAAATQ
jgi:DNA-binding GntR family transcriptional regulator